MRAYTARLLLRKGTMQASKDIGCGPLFSALAQVCCDKNTMIWEYICSLHWFVQNMLLHCGPRDPFCAPWLEDCSSRTLFLSTS